MSSSAETVPAGPTSVRETSDCSRCLLGCERSEEAASVAWLAIGPRHEWGDRIAVRDVWIALIAVGVGSVLTVFAQEVVRWLAKRQRRRALALLVCPALDRFVAACQAAIDDEGEWPDGTRHHSVPMPTGPQLPAEVDWTSIDSKLANRILSLPLATNRADWLLLAEAEIAEPPEHEEGFAARREQCFKLLRQASDLSLELRHMAKLPPASDTP